MCESKLGITTCTEVSGLLERRTGIGRYREGAVEGCQRLLRLVLGQVQLALHVVEILLPPRLFLPERIASRGVQSCLQGCEIETRTGMVACHVQCFSEPFEGCLPSEARMRQRKFCAGQRPWLHCTQLAFRTDQVDRRLDVVGVARRRQSQARRCETGAIVLKVVQGCIGLRACRIGVDRCPDLGLSKAITPQGRTLRRHDGKSCEYHHTYRDSQKSQGTYPSQRQSNRPEQQHGRKIVAMLVI